MFGVFCRPRLFFHVSHQKYITTTSLLTKASKPITNNKTTIQQRKKKSSPIKSPPKAQPLIFQQCAGLRLRDGKPCQRQISVDPKQILPSTLVYCHDHRPLIATTPTYTTSSTPSPTVPSPYLTSSSMESKRSIATSPIYDCWSLWIGKHIGPRKRIQIQQEMMKPISIKDEAGYLYAYHLLQGPRVSTHHYCYFKIGRSINPTRRVLQVIHKCNYQPNLLDIIPGKSPRKAKDDVMLKCPISHRVERLIHLELEALYSTNGGFKCRGCGTTHREWFRVKRPLVKVQEDGEKWRRMTDQEVWMAKIRPVMLHWIKYGVAIASLQQALGSPPLE